jgi:murein DD-endopeptidase MepM/ murein hydrolase activator NlpD
MKKTFLPMVFLFTCLSACGGGDGGSAGSGGSGGGDGSPMLTAVVDPTPGATNTLMPVLSRPFAGEYQVLNYFDHDVPTWPETTNGYQLNWRGAHAVPGKDIGGYDGHTGIDWLLPENTPLFAVTGGEIKFAGIRTFECPLQGNEIVNQLNIRLTFVAPNGDYYTAVYAHLNRVDVAVGDIVTEGQQIGLSGATGCLGKGHIPHLHFQLEHYTSLDPPQAFFVDPYGWDGPGSDPWSLRGAGHTSVWMWKTGQAPDMVPWRPPGN